MTVIDRLINLSQEYTSSIISYNKYIQEVLYGEPFGYYRRKHTRIGKNPDSDFYTAESLGEVFKNLLETSIKQLLIDEDLSQYTFVELGAELDGGLWQNSKSPFKEIKILKIGDPIEIPNPSIVFANELFDAQPFHRLIFTNNQWHERGVNIANNGSLRETLLDEPTKEIKPVITSLPQTSQEGYQLDFPFAAEQLLTTIVKQPWSGLLLIFDYGYKWEKMIYETPQGSARAYYKHRQHNNLLENPGLQDITCHICWDRLITILEQNGFAHPTLQKQESFFVHHATNVIESIVTKDGFSEHKQTLKELLHPTHMGHKFQVLKAIRKTHRLD